MKEIAMGGLIGCVIVNTFAVGMVIAFSIGKGE